jgi:hypothetical protein
MSLDSLRLTGRTTRYKCGIYDAGDPEKCYVKLFVTDAGWVMPLNHRMIGEEDLMNAYTQGRKEAVEDYGIANAMPADGGTGLEVPRAKRVPRVYEPEEEDCVCIDGSNPDPCPIHPTDTQNPSKAGQE